MQISERSLEVSDASSFRRKLWLVESDPRMLLGLGGPESRLRAPASVSEEAMLSLVPLPLLIPSRWAGLQPPLHSTQPSWETSATP